MSTWCNACSHNTSGCSDCFAYKRMVEAQVIYKKDKAVTMKKQVKR